LIDFKAILNYTIQELFPNTDLAQNLIFLPKLVSGFFANARHFLKILQSILIKNLHILPQTGIQEQFHK